MTRPMRPLRLGMVRRRAGRRHRAAHRRAARLDGRFELVAGAFSRNADANRAMGEELGIAPDRIYRDFAAMAEGRGARDPTASSA